MRPVCVGQNCCHRQCVCLMHVFCICLLFLWESYCCGPQALLYSFVVAPPPFVHQIL